MWSKLNVQYFRNYICKIYDGDVLVFEHKLNLKNKRVYIAFESKSLGDSLAWMSQCEEFRKKHECELVVSTFMNDLFKYRDSGLINQRYFLCNTKKLANKIIKEALNGKPI